MADHTWIIGTVVGSGERGFAGDGGPAAQASLIEPNGLGFDPGQRQLFIADVADHRVRVVDLAAGTIATFAGWPSSPELVDG